MLGLPDAAAWMTGFESNASAVGQVNDI